MAVGLRLEGSSLVQNHISSGFKYLISAKLAIADADHVAGVSASN